MKKKVLIIGSGGAGLSALAIQDIKDKYGEDVVIVTPEEAIEQGLKMEDFHNLPTMKIAPLLKNPYPKTPIKSGKQNRRDRRRQERKSKRK